MPPFAYIFCTCLLGSCAALPFWPDFFGSTTDQDNRGMEELEPITDEMLYRRPDFQSEPPHSDAEDATPTVPASLVLSEMSSMLESPSDDDKKYAAKKLQEFTDALEHEVHKAVWFTLGTANRYVDLGLKGSPTRSNNIQQSKSLLERAKEFICDILDWIKSWFVKEKKLEENGNQSDAANKSKNGPENKTPEPEHEHYVIADEKTRAKSDRSKKIDGKSGMKFDESAKLDAQHVDGRDSSIAIGEAQKASIVTARKDQISDADGVIKKSELHPQDDLILNHIHNMIKMDPAKAKEYFENMSVEEREAVKIAVQMVKEEITLIEREIKAIKEKIESENRTPTDSERERLEELKTQLHIKKTFVRVSVHNGF